MEHFYLYGIFGIVVIFEIIACEVGDFWNFVYYNESLYLGRDDSFFPESINSVYWEENNSKSLNI